MRHPVPIFTLIIASLMLTSQDSAAVFDSAAPRAEANAAAPASDSLALGLTFYRRALNDGQYAMAYHHLQRAAQSNDPAAMLSVAYLLATGKGVDIDPVRATQYLDQLPLQWLPRAAYVRGLIAQRHGDATIAVRDAYAWWTCAAEMGDTLAIHRLATVHERHRALRDANRLYQKSAADGLAVARNNAKRLMQTEKETLSRAQIAELKIRARRNDRDALYALARANHRGIEMPVNITTALQLYQRAARFGHREAARLAELMLVNREHKQRLDYAWVAWLAWSEPAQKSMALTPSPTRQVIQQELDPLWRVEAIAGAQKPEIVCEQYRRRGVVVPP